MDMYQKRKMRKEKRENSNQDEKFHKVVLNWGHGGSGSWTFTIHANSPNTGAHPASCIRYYCSRCSHYEDRHEEY